MKRLILLTALALTALAAAVAPSSAKVPHGHGLVGFEGGQPFSFSKSYGKKKGLTPITCTQHVEEDGFTSDATAVVALVPPAR